MRYQDIVFISEKQRGFYIPIAVSWSRMFADAKLTDVHILWTLARFTRTEQLQVVFYPSKIPIEVQLLI